MACPGNEPRSFCHFWGTCTQILHFELFCWWWGLLCFFYGILAHSSRWMVIWVKFAHSCPFLVRWLLRCWCLFLPSAAWPCSVLIHGSNSPGSYTTLFFVASDFSFVTRHINNWASYPLWPSCFIHSGAIGNSPLLFPSSILDIFRPGGLIFGVIPLWPFIQFMRFSWQVYWGGLHSLLHEGVCTNSSCESGFVRTLWQMTHPSWVALHGMAHSFIELYKPFHHKKAVVHEGDRLLQDIKYGSCAIQWVLYVYLFF